MNLLTEFSSGKLFLMEGALGERLKREYGLTFDDHVAMAALVKSAKGQQALQDIWMSYIEVAKELGLPFLAMTPTRRLNQDRLRQSNYDESLFKDNVDFLKCVRTRSGMSNMYVGGLLGCKGDAYKAEYAMSIEEAKGFHSWQCQHFKDCGVDYLFAGIMPELPEAIGMAQAMADTGLPYIISFMLNRDGRLLDGTTLYDGIAEIDRRVPNAPLLYMTNCLHPDILRGGLLKEENQRDLVLGRFRGIQANTSALSHEELDGALDLKTSDPGAMAEAISELGKYMDLKVVGGCCGTDQRHVRAMAKVLGELENV